MQIEKRKSKSWPRYYAANAGRKVKDRGTPPIE